MYLMKNLMSLEKKNPFLANKILKERSSFSQRSSKKFIGSDAGILYLSKIVVDERWVMDVVDWLESDKTNKLIIIEKNIAAIKYFLSLEMSIEVIDHNGIILASSPYEEVVVNFISSNFYKPWDFKGDLDTKRKIDDVIMQSHLIFSLYKDYGIKHINNIFANILSYDDESIKNGQFLFDKFRNIPAIICGAGPSLKNNIEFLKKLEDTCLIFGCGSSLIPLNLHGIKVHFGAIIDPYVMSDKFCDKKCLQVPLFYQNQLSNSVLKDCRDYKLCIGESGCFQLEALINLGLDRIDVGWSSLTFATAVACKLGCDPIIFVGADLCTSNGGSESQDISENNIECKDMFGNKVFSRNDFIMSKMWFEDFVKDHKKIKFINTSDCGLNINGMENRSLNTYRFGKCKYTRRLVDDLIRKAPYLNLKKAKSKIVEICNSAITCFEVFNRYGDDDIDGEIFYKYHLLPIWGVWKYLLQCEDVVNNMKNIDFEKQLQKKVFFKEVTSCFVKMLDGLKPYYLESL